MTKVAGKRRKRAPLGLTTLERFMSKVDVDPDTGCWIWAGSRSSKGYGWFAESHTKNTHAHRWAYRHFVGSYPAGMHLDHLCRVRHCANPKHLEPVTPRENVRRGVGHGKETHCPQNHPYDEANTYSHDGHRYCKTCRHERVRARTTLKNSLASTSALTAA